MHAHPTPGTGRDQAGTTKKLPTSLASHVARRALWAHLAQQQLCLNALTSSVRSVSQSLSLPPSLSLSLSLSLCLSIPLSLPLSLSLSLSLSLCLSLSLSLPLSPSLSLSLPLSLCLSLSLSPSLSLSLSLPLSLSGRTSPSGNRVSASSALSSCSPSASIAPATLRRRWTMKFTCAALHSACETGRTLSKGLGLGLGLGLG
jgi:hypothetical protein